MKRQQLTAAQKRALGAYIKLWRAAHAVELYAHYHLRQHSLTLSQFAVLEALYSLGPLNQKALAAKILRSTSNLTTVLDNLERQCLVCRECDPADRRAVQVRLSEQGQELIAHIMPVHVQMIEQAFAVLTTKEVELLAQLCRKLGITLSDEPIPVSLQKKRRHKQ